MSTIKKSFDNEGNMLSEMSPAERMAAAAELAARALEKIASAVDKQRCS